MGRLSMGGRRQVLVALCARLELVTTDKWVAETPQVGSLRFRS